MERGEDHFERGLARILGVFIDRDAAPVVGDGDLARSAGCGFERDLDAVGMASDRFVHRVVEHFGDEVVQRALVRAADVHAGAAADGFEPFEHLDGRAIIAFLGAAGGQLVEQGAGIVCRHRERL
jgi:hypothetical protein